MKQENNPPRPLIEYNEQIFFLVRASRKALRQYITKQSQEQGFTSPQMFVIFYVYKNPGINLNDLSERMELSKSTVSGIVDRLVAQRVVIREISEEDRRMVRLFLSPDFLQGFNIPRFRERVLTDLIKDASKKDLESIIYGLTKLLEHINKD